MSLSGDTGAHRDRGRSHLAGPWIGLVSVRARRRERGALRDLRVVLLGFSYGGMVVTGALDAIGDRVAERWCTWTRSSRPTATPCPRSPRWAARARRQVRNGLGVLAAPGRTALRRSRRGAGSALTFTPQPVRTFTEPTSPVPAAGGVAVRAVSYVRATREDVTGGAFWPPPGGPKESSSLAVRRDGLDTWCAEVLSIPFMNRLFNLSNT
ncbi:hypothetical protein HBB16_20035 [Pseudonocardia sp. MCCB 268]|nr:hypothetical protein [Pseudonocardia cytotoxica]